tara:strand:- start:1917 stop:2357 length:441 start_codon:yes stop_codon:yes gene_type:complete
MKDDHEENNQEYPHLSTQKKGAIGELAIKKFLIERGYPLYETMVDDDHIDLLVELPHGAFSRVQIKTVFKSRFPTSVEVRTDKHSGTNRIDVMAIYYVPKDIVAFIPYNGERNFVLAISHSKNNQIKERNWIYQYTEFPDFISRGK